MRTVGFLLRTATASLALLCALNSPLAFAQTFIGPMPPPLPPVDIVLGLEGTLVQGVPAFNLEALDKSQIITAGGRHYRIARHAKEMIMNLLADPRVRLSFTSDFPKAQAEAILAVIPTGETPPKAGGLRARAHQVLSKEQGTPLNLSAINPDPKQIVWVRTDAPEKVEASALVPLGPSYFHYDSFVGSQKGAETSKAKSPELFEKSLKAHFAPDAAAWEAEQNKLARAYATLAAALKASESKRTPFADALQQVKLSDSEATKVGLRELSLFYAWKYAPAVSGKPLQLLGCERRSRLDPTFAAAATTENCLKSASTRLEWKKAATLSCQRVTAEGALLKVEKLETCLEGLPVHYIWGSDQLQSCGAYTADYLFIARADSTKCGSSKTFCNPQTGVLEGTQLALINGTLQRLIPEILELPSGATLPPAILTNYSPSLIGASLIARHHKSKEKNAEVADPAYDFRRDSAIQMAFFEAYLDSIQTNGFMNQHQVGQSRGSLNPGYRAKVEDAMLGIKIESAYDGQAQNVAHRLRPKYSFLAPKSGAQSVLSGRIRSELSHYGNVVAVLKEEVKDRATFTAEDSLGDIPVFSFSYRPGKLPFAGQTRNYYEAQIWGDLTFNDVDHFIVNCAHAVAAQTIEKLKAAKRPIYGCAPDTHPGGALKEGELIFKPDAR